MLKRWRDSNGEDSWDTNNAYITSDTDYENNQMAKNVICLYI